MESIPTPHFCNSFLHPRPVVSLRCLIPGASGEMEFESILFLICLTSCTLYSCELVVNARDRHDYLLAPAKGCVDFDPDFTVARVGSLPSSSSSSSVFGLWTVPPLVE